MNIVVVIIGTWIVTDGIYSWTLYLNSPGYDGSPKQTFKKDHWLRGVRILMGITLIVIGAIW